MSRNRVLRRAIAPLTLVLALSSAPAHVHAAAMPPLLKTAMHNTDTVRTMQYTDQSVQTFTNGVVTIVVQGREDEVQNREADREVLVDRVTGKNGKVQTRGYEVDVVFVGGQTYYQLPLKDKTWHVKNGMAYNDGVGDFKRGRTTVRFDTPFNGVQFKAAGTAPNGDARFQGTVKAQGGTGTATLLVSTGKTPFVVELQESWSKKVKGKTVGFTDRTVYGPFNKALNISAPLSST